MSRADLNIELEVVRTGHGDPFRLEVDFVAPPGITILFGPSGSGKSTILQAVAGLVRPGRGRVALGRETWFDGAGGVHVPPHRRGVAYVFQSLALFPHMTAVGNVCYGMRRDLARIQRREQATALLARLGVAHLSNRRPRTFSGGEAQRVALARALAMEPRVMLLDEPFSALDRELRVQLARLVVDLVEELGIPAITVTHNHGEAAAMGRRILRMEAGRIVQVGSAADVLGTDRGGFEAIGKTPMPELVPR